MSDIKRERIKVEIIFDIHYTKEELRERAIDAAVNGIFELPPIYGANFTVEAVESKLITNE